MYLSFYNLKHKPFQISTDPKFLWLGEKHQEALAVLKYGVLDNKGFIALTGDVGTGKTTLVNALVRSLGEDVLTAMVPDPDLEPLDFYNYISQMFGIEKSFASKGSFLVYFRQFLQFYHGKGKKVLLIIDEAQRASQNLLEEIRLLSNIELEDTKLINIFFVGQSEFNNNLLKPENRALRQRITVNYNLSPLTEKETEAYIQRRLLVAGADKSIFTRNALHEVYGFSKGYPRLINIICDRAMLTGFVEDKKTIDARIVVECAGELIIKEYAIAASPMAVSQASPTIEFAEGGSQNISAGNWKEKENGFDNLQRRNSLDFKIATVTISILFIMYTGYILFFQ